MFLKRIELQGFKSFADKTIITFDHDVTGIVGPNGCGKSNINDAIRWVLGEQSAKSLRGGSMSDVIFSGSEHRNAVNIAEVSLIFDNTNRYFDVAFDEVSITRKLHRTTNEGEYFINKTPCRLKDITNMIMDTGLGRDSLSVITQGNISSFADAKAEDRRPLFEEAAGVARYKKRKNESLNKLNRTQDNLDRLEDIIDEIEKRLTPLKKQAKKAEIYIEKKKELEEIEISFLVNEIENLRSKIAELNESAFDYDSRKTVAEMNVAVIDAKNEEDRKVMSSLDRDVHSLQSKFVKVMEDIQALEARKVELEEKRKYALENANSAERQKQLNEMLKEAEFEYLDREKRIQDLKTNISLYKDKTNDLEAKIHDKEDENTKANGYFTSLCNRKEVLEKLVQNPYEHQGGMKEVLQAKDALYGIKGAVSQLLKPEEGYELAVSNCLGAAMFHIVSENTDAARQAIAFLKKNKSGRATFLPLTVLKDRYIDDDTYVICENSNGFLGTCDMFVTCEEEFEIVRNSLLANVLVCDTLYNATELAKTLHYRYKIVTLDGDIVHKGGSMTGGKNKDQSSPLTLEAELRKIKDTIEKQQVVVSTLKDQLNDLRRKHNNASEEFINYQLSLAKLQPVYEAKKAKYEKLKDELKDIEIDDSEDVITDDVFVELSKQYSLRDDIQSDLQNKRDKRYNLGQTVQKRENDIRNTRRDLNALYSVQKQIEIDLAKAQTNLDNVINRLSSTYSMTYEYAKNISKDTNEEDKEKVALLRNEIMRLGNVNLDAPNEYKEVSERYNVLTEQKQQLVNAREKILSAIDEMDDVMVKQFKEMFDKINVELDDTFKSLFGGGRARLYLSDPEDVLNSGIEIDAQPPGKKLVSMTALSGGEKSMLAMCVLFAMLKARTVPLCIFDEVEAALDQANVERFAKYISNFRGNSQFIIVTHRPGTMEKCDALYGITMKKDGVSKLLKVTLHDALGYINEEDKN